MSAVVVGAGLVLTGCSTIKLGAAAIVGSQRITVATLDTEVTDLSQAAKANGVNLTAGQETQQTLTWLVRFQINEELARQAGITISLAQSQSALKQAVASAQSSYESEGMSNPTQNFILVSSGIPPNMSGELGRYESIEIQFIERVNGGTIPTATAAQTATTAKLTRAQCSAAKNLRIEINPQFGRFNYTEYEVVPSSSTVSRAGGPAKAPSLAGLTPAC